jgi:hypothetical protein
MLTREEQERLQALLGEAWGQIAEAERLLNEKGATHELQAVKAGLFEARVRILERELQAA